MRRFLVLTLIAVLGLSVIGFAQLGTQSNPIIWLLPPSTLPATIDEVGGAIAQDLYDLTGYYVDYAVAADYAALNEAMISADGNTMACPTTEQYAAITNVNPAVHCRLASVRYGYEYYYASIYYLRDSGFTSIADLDGKKWIYAYPGSTSGYIFPNLLFELEGITPSDYIESGGHTNSVIALLEGQGDFATGYGSQPVFPDWAQILNPDRIWEWGDPAELFIWDDALGELYAPGARGMIRDVRYAVANATTAYGSHWDIIEKVGILDVVGPIPNDCLAFCENFPIDIENAIVEAVKTHIASAEGLALWNNPNFYEWSAVKDVDTTFYNVYRELVGYPTID
jgi:ABC-type phosphate/phosphonate transport system substrate-binding protein